MGEEIIKLTVKWRNWQYKNTGILVLSLVLFFIFAEHPIVKSVISLIGSFGYIGAFITGILFVSVFTVAPAAVVLFFLADTLNPLIVAFCAGAGAVLGDYLIFRFLKDRVFEEIGPLFMKNGGNRLEKLFKTPYFGWFLPFLGAFIIASPFPDEVGIGMMGLSKIKTWQFMILTFLLNTTGIFIVIITAHSF